MSKIFCIYDRYGRRNLNFIVQSHVTGEVFLLMLDDPDPEYPFFHEVWKMLYHICEVRQWVKSGVIKFAGNQVVYTNAYF